MKSIFLCEDKKCPLKVFSPDSVNYLMEKANLDSVVYSKDDLINNAERFKDTEYIFSSWGMVCLDEAEIKQYLPSLKAVFYAAGTVQYFARPFLNSGVKIFSAWAANAVPVAEYTVAQIILANKGFFGASRIMKSENKKDAKRYSNKFFGNYGNNIGIIGAGMIGKLVIKMLKAYNFNVFVFDPFLSDETAEELCVTKCSLEFIFKNCTVVSNHLANNSETKGMLNKELFEIMPLYSTFINTGRGAQVIENDLVEVLEERPDLTAILDVTDPEPPLSGHKFYTLDNCVLTPHIAGSMGKELNRMGEYMVEEFIKFTENKPCKYEVTLEMLKTMA